MDSGDLGPQGWMQVLCRSWVPSTMQGQTYLLQSLSHLQVIVAIRGVVRLGGRAV